MKKLLLQCSMAGILLAACNKDLSINKSVTAGTVSVTETSTLISASATVIAASDSLTITYNGSGADSICWIITGDTLGHGFPFPPPPPPPPGDSTGNHGDHPGGPPPPFPPHDTTGHNNDDTTQMPHDSTFHPPFDTNYHYPPVDTSFYGDPDSTLHPGTDSGYFHNDSICHNLDSAGLHRPGHYHEGANTFTIYGRQVNVRIQATGSYIIMAKAYAKLADGTYKLVNTGYARITAH